MRLTPGEAHRRSAAYAAATSEPKRALFFTRAMLAVRLAPPVISAIRASRKGVTSLPETPRASARACSMMLLISSAGISSSAGMGQATARPPLMPRSHLAEHGDAERLEDLQRQTDVQNALHAR